MKKFIIFLISLVICLNNVQTAFSQDDTSAPVSYRSSLQLIYTKTATAKSFAITLNYINNDPWPVEGAKIKITAGPEREIVLGEVSTEPNGKITFNLKPEASIPKDQEGFYVVQAVYEGNDSIQAAESEVKFQDFTLKMELDEADSSRTITLKCFQINDKGQEIPPTEMVVNVYVARMFSNLKIGEVTLDSTGIGTFEFPYDLVGDSIGNLTIVARIDEHEIFGNVEVRQMVKWGIPTFHKVPKGNRALWTQIAPTWMIITLVIMLVGVWGHYAYAIINIRRIKKAGKKSTA